MGEIPSCQDSVGGEEEVVNLSFVICRDVSEDKAEAAPGDLVSKNIVVEAGDDASLSCDSDSQRETPVAPCVDPPVLLSGI